MDEEKDKEGLQTEENTGENQADSQADTGTPDKSKEAEIDWQQRHKDLQADYTRKAQRVAELEEQVAAPPAEEPTEPDEYEGEFIDKKKAQQMIDAAVRTERMRTANTYFRTNYPDHVKYENAISGIMRSPKDAAKLKGASPEERIDAAVKEYNDQTEEQKTAAAAKAEADAKAREEQNRKAAGLGGPSTPPSKSDEEGQSDAEELATRKAQSAKRRGLA